MPRVGTVKTKTVTPPLSVTGALEWRLWNDEGSPYLSGKLWLAGELVGDMTIMKVHMRTFVPAVRRLGVVVVPDTVKGSVNA